MGEKWERDGCNIFCRLCKQIAPRGASLLPANEREAHLVMASRPGRVDVS